jgi:hypothetical protein
MSLVTIVIAALYLRSRPSDPTLDEFAIYQTLLTRLTKDWESRRVSSPVRFALSDMSLELVEPGYQEWIPAELRPYPPDKIDPPESIVAFCGRLCGNDFLTKNLDSRKLKPGTIPKKFPFVILSFGAETVATTRGICTVRITRPGFDRWHDRAVIHYLAACGGDSCFPSREEASRNQAGEVLLEKRDGSWRVESESLFHVIGGLCRDNSSLQDE